MNKVTIYIPALIEKLQEMSADDMTLVQISVCDETVDQFHYSPAFLHFEAIGENGAQKDYESIDSLSPPNLDLLRTLDAQSVCRANQSK